MLQSRDRGGDIVRKAMGLGALEEDVLPTSTISDN
jgi:hypothetical protein